jgi:hypothetical protein
MVQKLKNMGEISPLIGIPLQHGLENDLNLIGKNDIRRELDLRLLNQLQLMRNRLSFIRITSVQHLIKNNS